MTEINFKKKLWQINEPDAINAETVTIDNNNISSDSEAIESATVPPLLPAPIKQYIETIGQTPNPATLPDIHVPKQPAPPIVASKLPTINTKNPIYEFGGMKFEQQNIGLNLIF